MNQNSKTSVLRIIDAAQNRAAEGLRVVEDCARMHKEDAFLALQIKQLRHDLTKTLQPIDSVSLLQSRDPASDVGRNISTLSEFQRDGFSAIVRSNFSRVLQSLRTMEEYSKFLADTYEPAIPNQLEQLRYQTYVLEKAVYNTMISSKELDAVCTYVLTDCRNSLAEFESLVRSLIEADVGLIQLREKSLDDRELVQRGKLLTEMTRDVRTRWIMNDRPDLALVTGADGVHVGQEDLTVHESRQVIGPGKLIGVSTHNLQQAQAAELAGANYIGVGPCFPSGTKNFDEFISPEFISNIVSQISVPAFAIGGIDETNVDRLARLGVKRVAVSKSVVESDDRTQTVQKIKVALQEEIVST